MADSSYNDSMTHSLEDVNIFLNTNYIGRNYIYHQELDSTNAEAKRLNKENKSLKTGTVILSDSQTCGKGKGDRKWFSPKGVGLWFSIVIENEYFSRDISLFPLVIGAAVCSSLKSQNVEAKLKWPNDIYIGNRKIGGILCERTINSSFSDYIIVGIGLNVNTKPSDFPDFIKETAGSILSEAGMFLDRKKTLCSLLNTIEEYIDMTYKKNDKNTILNYIKEHSNTINRNITLLNPDGTTDHVFAEDIDQFGRLIITNSANKKSALVSGEVSLLLD